LGWKGCSEGKDMEIMNELSDSVDTKIILRNTYSLLKSPGLKEKLEKHKIDQVDICGFDTDCCVLATTYDLFDSGYKPVVLKQLCFSTSKEKLHGSALKIIKRNCGFLLG
jgi:nicotinamidase-related amidase